MDARFMMGRVWGLPLFVSLMFLVTLVFYEGDLLGSGNPSIMLIGVVLAGGICLSVLAHALAHAVTGSYLGLRPVELELSGFGGSCRWAGSFGAQPILRRVIILTAGPLANLALYFALMALLETPAGRAHWLISTVVMGLASVNYWLCVFNLLPAYPLDGGLALEALLGAALPYNTCRRIVSVLGLCVAALFAYLGVSGNIWLLVVAFSLGFENYGTLQAASSPPTRRW